MSCDCAGNNNTDSDFSKKNSPFSKGLFQMATKFSNVGFSNSAAPGAEKVYSDDETVALRVGGKRFETTVGTLRKYGESKLAAMFPEDAATKVPESNEFAFDRYVLVGKIQKQAPCVNATARERVATDRLLLRPPNCTKRTAWRAIFGW